MGIKGQLIGTKLLEAYKGAYTLPFSFGPKKAGGNQHTTVWIADKQTPVRTMAQLHRQTPASIKSNEMEALSY